MLVTHLRYGVHLGFASDPSDGAGVGHVEVAPFGPEAFSLRLRGLSVAFSPSDVSLDVARAADPDTTKCAVRLFPVLKSTDFAVSAAFSASSPFNMTVTSSADGELSFIVPLGDDGRLVVSATASV